MDVQRSSKATSHQDARTRPQAGRQAGGRCGRLRAKGQGTDPEGGLQGPRGGYHGGATGALGRC